MGLFGNSFTKPGKGVSKEEAAKRNRQMWHLKPSKVFPLTASIDEVVTYVESLF